MRSAATLLLALTLTACGTAQPDSGDGPGVDATQASEQASETHSVIVQLIDTVPFNGTTNIDDVDCAGRGTKAGQLVLKDSGGEIVALHTVDYVGKMDGDRCIFSTMLEGVNVSDYYVAEWTTPSGEFFEQTFEGVANRTTLTLNF